MVWPDINITKTALTDRHLRNLYILHEERAIAIVDSTVEGRGGGFGSLRQCYRRGKTRHRYNSISCTIRNLNGKNRTRPEYNVVRVFIKPVTNGQNHQRN